MIGVYWTLLLPFFVFLLILETLKIKSNPNPAMLVKRLFLSVILLLSFDDVLGIISMLGEEVTGKINGVNNLPKVLTSLWENFSKNEVNFFKVKEALLFTMGILSYLVAYIGVFISHVVIHLCWSILYVFSPLMILMYLSDRTEHITLNLYKGLITVVSWKLVWSVLGVILLELAMKSSVSGWDDFFTTMTVNLCIGLSMLFVPFTTKSLLSNGLSSLATSLSAAPAYATMKGLKYASRQGLNRAKTEAISRFRKGRELVSNMNTRRNLSKNMSLKPKNVINVDFKNKRKDDD